MFTFSEHQFQEDFGISVLHLLEKTFVWSSACRALCKQTRMKQLDFSICISVKAFASHFSYLIPCIMAVMPRLCVFFLMFIFERERERVKVGERREREGDTKFKSRLLPLSCQQRAQHRAQTHEL